MVQISTPLGWPLTGEWAVNEALFVKLLWPVVIYSPYRSSFYDILMTPNDLFRLCVPLRNCSLTHKLVWKTDFTAKWGKDHCIGMLIGNSVIETSSTNWKNRDFHLILTVVKMPVDAREHSSCISNYWLTAFQHLKFHKMLRAHNRLLGEADVDPTVPSPLIFHFNVKFMFIVCGRVARRIISWSIRPW